MKELEDGSIIVDWEEVEKLMKKDADKISDMEYYALAILYLGIDDAEIPRFLKLLMVEKKKLEWKADEEKVRRLTIQMERIADTLLLLEQKSRRMGEDEYKEIANSLFYQRGTVHQRGAILEAVNEVGSFWGRSPGEGPLLSIDLPEKSSKEGDTLILKYMEFNINAAPSLNQYWSWDEGVITVSPNVSGKFIDDDTRKYAKEVTLGRFSAPSLSGKSWEFLTQEATSQALSEVSEALEKKAGKCIAGSIPVVGDIVAAGIDYHQQKKEGEENQKYIEEMYKRLDIADIYSEFDCTAVFVTYETKEYKRTDMNVSEGCTTMERIEAVNQGCDTDITMEELLSSPLSIGEKVEDRRLDYNNAMSEIDAKSQ